MSQKFRLKEGQGAVRITQGPFTAAFTPGAVVEVENSNFAAFLARHKKVESVGDGGQGMGDGETQKPDDNAGGRKRKKAPAEPVDEPTEEPAA